MNAWRWFGKIAAVASAVVLTGCYLHYRVTRNSVAAPASATVPFADDSPFVAPSDSGPTDEGGSIYMYSSKSAPMLPSDAVEGAGPMPPPGIARPQFLPGSKFDIVLPPNADQFLPGSKDAVPVFDAGEVLQSKPTGPAPKAAPPAAAATQSEQLLLPGSKSLAPVFQPPEGGGTKSTAK